MKLMKQVIIALFICCMALSGLSAQDMPAVFTNMPDQYVPQLESEWRKDLIDLYKSEKEARLQNMMGGYSELNSLTDDYLSLRSTERTTIELKLLPLVNNTHIICMVTTVEGPVADSRVDFFTTEWEPLESTALFTPVDGEWFIREDVDKNNEDIHYAISHLDMDLIRYELHAEAPVLTATYTTPLYLNKLEREKVVPFLKEDPKVYTWEKIQFK